MSAAAQDARIDEIEVIVGGILDLNAIQYISDEADRDVPAMPVIYDDGPVAPDEDVSIPTNDTPKPQTANE
jgi:hypothetical protein